MIHALFKIFNWLGSEWILFVLFGLSIYSVWIILSRYAQIRNLSRMSDRFWSEKAEGWFHRGTVDPTVNTIELRLTYPCLESDALEMIGRTSVETALSIEKAVSAFLDSKKMKLEKNIGILGTIGANAPFIGLLGTVLGIIRAFHDMSLQGLGGGMENISSGIAEALVATAVGLFVAIPAVIFFNILNKKISILARRASNISQFAISNRQVKE